MGVFDKLKNALFEVEYVEVEEKPKKEKTKFKEKSSNEEDKPIAKKIVLPGKREEKVERIQEEEMKDEDFEIRPINETVKENPGSIFKFMDDEDFAMDDNSRKDINNSIPSVEEVPSRRSRSERSVSNTFDNSYDRGMNVENENPYNRPIHAVEENNPYDRPINAVEDSNPYDRPIDAMVEENPYNKPVHPVVENSYVESNEDNNYINNMRNNASKESRPYGVDNTTFEAAKDYGTYENKDEKSYFKPSPIISPIYGILDKNYRKEDVVAKKDIRITTNYSRSNVNVDSIRDKAYGRRSNNTPVITDNSEPEIVESSTFEVEEEDEEPLLVDLSDDKEKPEVKAITVGDAMEYFDDLGLEYNVDYVDATNKNKKKNNGLEEDIKYNMDSVAKEKNKPIPAPVAVPEPELVEAPEIIEAPKKIVSTKPKIVESVDTEVKKSNSVVEVKEESDNSVDDDDNLFDLIDSMYKDEED